MEGCLGGVLGGILGEPAYKGSMPEGGRGLPLWEAGGLSLLREQQGRKGQDKGSWGRLSGDLWRGCEASAGIGACGVTVDASEQQLGPSQMTHSTGQEQVWGKSGEGTWQRQWGEHCEEGTVGSGIE